ncbi:MAG: glycosyltransferase family 2 protein [Rubricella sp.]
MLSVAQRLALRLKRRRLQLSAIAKSRELKCIVDRSSLIRRGDVLLASTLRNERIRLPFFFDFYRSRGIGHFLIVDNGSDDGSFEWLRKQPDVTLWRTTASYKASRFGMDWLNAILARKAAGHWVLTVDVDEFLLYPHGDVRPIRALTDWLDNSSLKAFPAMLLDMYSDGPIEQARYSEGKNPFDILQWFDPAGYTIRRNRLYGNLWIQGGPRMRAFFGDSPERAPALNKVPLVRWARGYVYHSSTHSLLPRGLNRVYDEWGGEKPSGCLLHAKFLHVFKEKALEEAQRRQHYADSREYSAYRAGLNGGRTFWTEQSERLSGWRQLEDIGLMSSGGWI